METRANFILIGLFTLAGVIGIIGLFLWFAQVELDRQFDYYDVNFSSVSGLSAASDVRFSGLPVGQVVDVRLSPTRDGSIVVRLEVDAETPVRTDSIATIESQGVTGVSFVQIGPGTPEGTLYESGRDDEVPVLEAGRSVIQSLSEDAPELVNETLRVVSELRELFGDDNQQRVNEILTNVEEASDIFASTLEDFSGVAGSVSTFAEQIGEFTAILNELAGDLEGVLQTADDTLARIGALTTDAEAALQAGTETLTVGTETLTVARDTFAGADAYLKGDLTTLTATLQDTVSELRSEVSTISETLRSEIESVGTGLNGEIGSVGTSLRDEIAALGVQVDTISTALVTEIDSVGSGLNAEVGVIGTSLRDEIAALGTEIDEISAALLSEIDGVGSGLNSEVNGIGTSIRDQIAALGTEVDEISAALLIEIDSIGTGLNTEVGGVGTSVREQIAALGTEIDTIGETLRREIETVGAGIDTEITTFSADVRGQITTFTASIRSDVETLSQTLRSEVSTLSTDAQGLIETFNATGLAATARLTEAEKTLASVDLVLAEASAAFEAVDEASTNFDTLLAEEGEPLLIETRVAVADAASAIQTISDTVEADLPSIVEDVRTGIETASAAIQQVAADLSTASGRVEGLTASAETALAQVTETFANANATLTAVNGALETGDRALVAAERAFQGADRVINEDIDGIITGLETSLASLNGAIAQVSEDLPEITAELTAASRSAEGAFRTLQQVAASAGPAVSQFARTGLPLYTRLADETRGLIRNLDRLTQQIQRDPARFFLNQQSPEFRR